MRVREVIEVLLSIALIYPQLIDPGTQQIPNGLVLTHVMKLDAKYDEQKRQHSIPTNLQKALRDLCLSLASLTYPRKNFFPSPP